MEKGPKVTGVLCASGRIRKVVLSGNNLFPIKVIFGQDPSKRYVTQIKLMTVEKGLLS